MKWSLRAQLLSGLAVILVVVALTSGLITIWALGASSAEARFNEAQRLAGAITSFTQGILSEQRSRSKIALQRSLSQLVGESVRQIAVHRASGPAIATVGERRANQKASATRQRVFTTGQVLVERDRTRRVLIAHSPVIVGGEVSAVTTVSVQIPDSSHRLGALFWVLMILDGLVLLVFVGFVVTRYVARPVERLQRAASQVAAGDLNVSLTEAGSIELAGLARSFNQMTASLREQLERLQQQQEQIVRSEKLASVGQLAAGVAHEVGNPLQSIVGFTDLLARGQCDQETRADLLKRIESESTRISEILRDLLEYSRPAGDQTDAVEIAGVVNQAWQLVRAQQRAKSVHYKQRDLAALPPVAISRHRLIQVILNLLLNAVDAMDGEGDLEVWGEQSSGDQVKIFVGNSGPAISSEDRGRIFDPFYTTKNPGQGTGLGLAVSRSLVESYGGTLELLDQPRTVFVVGLRVPRGGSE